MASGQAETDRQAAVVAYCRLIARNLDGLDDRGRRELLRQKQEIVVSTRPNQSA